MDARLRRRLPRILASAVIMGLVLWGLQALGGEATITGDTRTAWLALMVVGGATAYFLAAALAGAMRPSELRRFLRRSPKGGAA